jgi:hypothetical protein
MDASEEEISEEEIAKPEEKKEEKEEETPPIELNIPVTEAGEGVLLEADFLQKPIIVRELIYPLN